MLRLSRFAASTTALALAALAGFAFQVSTSQAADDALKSGDRLVFLGDSITQGGAGPKGYISVFKEILAERKPDLKVEVIGAGISGNKVPDLEARLERDVISKKPSVVVIYIGINDVWHSESGKGTSKEDFDAGLRRIIKKIDEAGGRVVLCTASVIGEKTDGSNKLDKMLDEYCDVTRKVAAETKSQLLDLRKGFLTHLKEHNKNNDEAKILTTDRVHLNDAGNRFVAEQMFTALVGGEQASGKQSNAKRTNPNQAEGEGEGKSMLRHVVLFKFKDDASKEQVKGVTDAFSALPGKIDSIKAFEWGTDVGVENLAQGFTHCFIVTFADEKGRDAYLPHAAHEDFKKIVGPVIDKVLVVDFWTKK
jgi:lysophospholipase L1-like esterase